LLPRCRPLPAPTRAPPSSLPLWAALWTGTRRRRGGTSHPRRCGGWRAGVGRAGPAFCFAFMPNTGVCALVRVEDI
jgi:hypothetical protein